VFHYADATGETAGAEGLAHLEHYVLVVAE
jgi:hypothetical protein